MEEKLVFGTGGVRAKMGPAPNEINTNTIRLITQGLASYLKTLPEKEWKRGVVICHDSRLHGREFALETASVLAGNDIPVFIVPELRPTPFASFAVRHLHAKAGINLTASHNPKDYNGYKVYWDDGAQVVSPHDTGIMASVSKVGGPSHIKLAPSSPLIKTIAPEVDKAYLQAIKELSIQKLSGEKLSIIYSPLNGAGITMIPKALALWGFSNVHLVEEQKNPDGNFPTTPYPNPETEEALRLGVRDLKKRKADILLVSDPDSDRLSLAILHDGKPIHFTGNELGALLLHHLLTTRAPKEPFAVVTTIVSTRLIKLLTERAHGSCFEVLTGFKYIGEKIHEWETHKNSPHFLFGMEESLGYLYGTHARDKDATIAACLTAEMALLAKQHKKSLLDILYDIYRTYGIYRTGQASIESPSLAHMAELMSSLRKELPKALGGVKVLSVEDYLTRKATDLTTKKESPLDLPKSDVLIFHLADKSKFVFRPSGTEPKLKIYGEVTGSYPSILQGIQELDKKLHNMLETLKKSLS
ncbi:MAG: phospho-sugar mutase [Verrucomicrobia bacterium]|nr:phospho-sugar mutase [Verrucomicrobiota bacterium]